MAIKVDFMVKRSGSFSQLLCVLFSHLYDRKTKYSNTSFDSSQICNYMKENIIEDIIKIVQ